MEKERGIMKSQIQDIHIPLVTSLRNRNPCGSAKNVTVREKYSAKFAKVKDSFIKVSIKKV